MSDFHNSNAAVGMRDVNVDVDAEAEFQRQFDESLQSMGLGGAADVFGNALEYQGGGWEGGQ